MFFLKLFENIIFAGVEGSFKTSQNRGVLATNLINIWGYISLFLVGLFLLSNNVSMKTYSITFFFVAIAGFLSIYLNSKKKYNKARILTFITINVVSWNAVLLFGKSFNGYYYFFVALVFLFLLMSKVSKVVKFFSYLVVFISLPIVDFLSFKEIIPITGLHSSQFSSSLLITDSLFVSFIIATLILVEKTYFDMQEDQLLLINEDLEKIVEVRTALLLKSKLDNIKSEQIKAQFLANISHEVRIPVQGILGFTELANRKVDKVVEQSESMKISELKKLASNLKVIEKSSTRLMELLEKLFLITRDEEEAFKPINEKFDFYSVMSEVTSNLNLGNLKLSVIYDEVITKPLTCDTDETFLRQSLKCILENAVVYSLGEEIKVEVSKSKGTLFVRIENQGPGIADEDVEEIFNPFFQGSRTDRHVGGTGLGLSLCRKYIESINGTVALSNNSPEKTQFSLSFPISLKA